MSIKKIGIWPNTQQLQGHYKCYYVGKCLETLHHLKQYTEYSAMTSKLHNGIVIMSIIYEVNPHQEKPSADSLCWLFLFAFALQG